MKKIEVSVRPSKLDEVRRAMSTAGIRGVTVTNVTGFGPEPGKKDAPKGSAKNADRVEALKIEAVVPDGLVRDVVLAVEKSAETDGFAGGDIRILEVEDAVRIRTGERGPDVV